jgi:hypothetical protein
MRYSCKTCDFFGFWLSEFVYIKKCKKKYIWTIQNSENIFKGLDNVLETRRLMQKKISKKKKCNLIPRDTHPNIF